MKSAKTQQTGRIGAAAKNKPASHSARPLELHELIAERRLLETTISDACDSMVIPLLVKCLAFFEESRRSTKTGKRYRGDIQHFHRNSNVVLGGRTANPIVNLVGCVFFETWDHLPSIVRSFIYCEVLRDALANDVKAGGLETYIAQCGGIRAVANPTQGELKIANEDLGARGQRNARKAVEFE